MKFKNVLTAMLCFLLICSCLLTSCDQQNNENEPSMTTGQTTQATTNQTTEPTTNYKEIFTATKNTLSRRCGRGEDARRFRTRKRGYEKKMLWKLEKARSFNYEKTDS